MKKTSAKNTTSRSAKATGGRAAGRTQRAASNAKSAATGSRKAATSRTSTASKSTAKPAAKPTAKTATASRTTAKPAGKTAPKKTASRTAVRSNRATTPKTAARTTAPKAATRNSRATSRAKQTSAKDLLLEFFHDELKDIYWAEKNIVKTLPKMKKAASSPELQAAFDAHLLETQEHVSRLEQVFDMLGKKAQAKKCEAMNGIIKEGEEIITDTEAGTATRDVGLILAAQKVEHYEIATYGGLAQLARTLRLPDVAEVLEATLDEEKGADSKLTNIAESHVNYDALHESEGPQAAAAPLNNVGGDDDDEDEDEDDVTFEEADIDDEEVADDDDEDFEEDDLDEDEDDDDDEDEDEQI